MSEVEAASPAGKQEAKKGFLARVIGVFVSPGETFEDVGRKPTLIMPILVLLIAMPLISYITTPYAIQDNPERLNSPQFQSLSEEQQQQQLELFRVIGTVASPVFLVVITLFFALVYWGLGNLMGGEPTFKGTLSMLLFTQMVSIVANFAVKIPLMIQKESVAGVTFSPALAMPDLEITSVLYQVLAALDVFFIWGTILVGIGLSKVARISTGAGMAVAILVFIVATGLRIGVGAAFS